MFRVLGMYNFALYPKNEIAKKKNKHDFNVLENDLQTAISLEFMTSYFFFWGLL